MMGQEFCWRLPSEEEQWTCGESIAAGLQNGDKAADFGPRKLYVDSQQVSGIAGWTCNAASYLGRIRLRQIPDEEVGTKCSSEAASSSKMVVQAAVYHEKSLTPRFFAANDPHDIDAGVGRQEAAQFEDDPSLHL